MPLTEAGFRSRLTYSCPWATEATPNRIAIARRHNDWLSTLARIASKFILATQGVKQHHNRQAYRHNKGRGTGDDESIELLESAFAKGTKLTRRNQLMPRAQSQDVQYRGYQEEYWR